jgi:ABC-type antimicrobial peptide transport system permease subunit
MRFAIVLKIALKNLWAHKLRTTLTVLGVMIGISSIIFLVSLGYGLEQLVTNQVASFDAFTVIDVPSASISTVKIDQKILDRIASLPHVTKTAPGTNIAGRVRKPEESSTAETIVMGSNLDYWKLANISPDQGRMPDQPTEAAVNKSVLQLIGEDPNTIIGKNLDVDLIIPAELRANVTDGVKLSENNQLKIVGLLNDEKSPVVYVSMGLLTSQGADKFSTIKIKADTRDNVDALRKQIENIGFSTEYVGDTVKEIEQVFTLFRAILFAFGLIALIVAALGTFNTLTISLLERTREVGLFKTLGMRNKDIYKLFLAESLIIGIFGGLFGLLIGFGLGQAINLSLSILANRSGSETITLFLTPWQFALGVALFSIFVGFATGWYPSRRAVKIDPLDALKYE